MSTTPRRSIALTLLAIGGLLSTAPEARAALSFDLNESPSYGYSTRTADNQFDSVSQGTTFNATGALVQNPNSLDFNFTGTGANPNFSRYADIDISNITTINGYEDRLNEFYINYTLGTTTSNGGNPTVTLWWSPTQQSGSSDFTGFTFVNQLANGANRLHFQGEDLYPDVVPPLLENGSIGTLRFLFTGTGPLSNSGGTAALSYVSITAVVPEPSSALLLSGVLGLFGTTFRRRRVLSAAGPSL